MNLCSDNHDEVCYEGSICPVCELIDQHNEKLAEIEEEYKDKISDLNAEISELNSQLS